MKFDNFCEQIFKEWMDGSSKWKDFQKHFLLNHIPEPYYTIQEGEKTLYVLNYNPGYGLPIQLKDTIKKQKHDSFKTVSKRLSQYYMETLKGPAYTRNEKILKLAAGLGFDGIKCVETFFLHSAKFNGKIFLKKYGNHALVQEYSRILKDYLQDKPVLAIGAINPNTSVEKLKEGTDVWLNFRCNMIDLDLKNAEFISATQKNGKMTSGLFIGKNRKIASVMMGSNSLPTLESTKMKQISDIFNR